MNKLNKEKAYTLLYQYAKNQISDEDKTAVEEYMQTDEESRNIAETLRELHPKLTYARDDEKMFYIIMFELKDENIKCYFGTNYFFNDYKRRNDYIEANGGNTPENEKWFSHRVMDDTDYPCFDNEGNPMEFVKYKNENDKLCVYCKNMKKIYYPVHWNHMSEYYIKYDTPNWGINKTKEAPNLYNAKINHNLGCAGKVAIYLALPENATNIRMKRGNGVLDCGKYKFIYADRYVAADEGIFAECTFNM